LPLALQGPLDECCDGRTPHRSLPGIPWMGLVRLVSPGNLFGHPCAGVGLVERALRVPLRAGFLTDAIPWV